MSRWVSSNYLRRLYRCGRGSIPEHWGTSALKARRREKKLRRKTKKRSVI
jgi:hypothetical protein